MKLSLDMIAIQLKDADVFLHINEERSDKYRSSRTFRSAGNLYVTQSGADTYVYGNYPDSYILFKNAQEDYVQNVMLDIFDLYAEWIEALHASLEAEDMQTAINICYEMFGNPVFILSHNGKLLAITNKVDKDQLNNPEWDHYMTYGYSSYQNFQKFRAAINKQASWLSSEAVLYKNPPTADRTEFMISMICDRHTIYGRFTVMGYFRKLTEGDAQLLSFVSDVIARHLAASNKKEHHAEGSSILLNMFRKKMLSEHEKNELRQYYSWKEEEIFRVCVLSRRSMAVDDEDLFQEYLEGLFPNCPVLKYEQKTILVLAGDAIKTENLVEKLEKSCVREWNVTVGLSLEFRELEKAYEYLAQAIYAISKAGNKERIAMFYHYGLEFLLSLDSAEQKLLAIHPDVAEWIRRDGSANSESINTLYTYLLYERSLRRAAEAIFVHRNTLLYRIGKLTGEMKYDLDEPYTRQYVLTSILLAKNAIPAPENAEKTQ